MAETTKKAVRLSKAAREFNVGIHTIVEFLGEKGIEVESSPNTKIEPEVYGILIEEYSSDKSVKEKSQNVNLHRAERETITLESAKAKENEVEEEVEVDFEALRKAKEEKEAASKKKAEEKEAAAKKKADEEAAEAVKKAEEEEKKKAEAKEKEKEEVKEEEKVEEKAEEKAEEVKASEAKSEVKVVGKVDLEKSKKKTKKEIAAEEKAAAEKVAADEKAAEETAAADKAAAKAAEAAEKDSKVIRATTEKLSGPTVVGKIKLPEKHVPKPKVTDDSKSKRKRKRVAKVDVEKQAKENRNVRQRAKKKAGVKPEISQADIQKEIKDTLARLSGGGGKSKASKFRRAKRDAVQLKAEEDLIKAEEEKSILKLTEFVTVSELANMMDKDSSEIISACMTLGIFASINQRLDAETITVIADEFGFQIEFVSADVQESILVEDDDPADLVSRPPIVTVMGHVDHGKTSLLDYVRSANVIAGEAGGITQHIGAYSVTLESGKVITFLDTPGHEAFTAMRARGAQVTDLAIIVIAADDAVMPQTKEAINHAQAAGIPMIFALNKMDRQAANPDKIKEELSAMNILVEDWGGKYQCQEISAKNGTNIDELLEKVLLEAELLELTANPTKRAHGAVLESTLDKGRGYVTTLLVEAGTMKVGDAVLAGQWSGKVKAMFNERGQTIEVAGPATPVSMLGMSGAPSAGDTFNVLESEREARDIAIKRQQLQREQGVRAQKHVTIEEIGRRIALGEFRELNLIVKGDVDGSIEALSDSLQKLSTEKVQVNIIHRAVGQISESDVLLASASDAIIIGFQVRPSATARRLAEKEEIQIRLYSIIYKAIEEVKDAMEGLLSAKIEEKILGTAEIREVFKITKVGTIAGCFMLDGKIARNNKVRVIRDGIVIYTGELGSLKRFKDDVKEVTKGFECGLNVDKFNDIKVGDNIEAFEEVEVKQTL